MIEVTVKTLDSQNHPFSVEDDITVKEFKDLISDKVNIPAATQRLIYCGRVLQDVKKLNEYEVNGKVVHLVQRAPPQPNARSNNGTPNTTTDNASSPLFHVRPNQIYVGSMAYTADMLDAHGIGQLPLSQNFSSSRLNVARKMLRLANNIIEQLENQGSDNATANTTQDQILLEDPIDTSSLLAAEVDVSALRNIYGDQSDQMAEISAALSVSNNLGNILGNNNRPDTTTPSAPNATASSAAAASSAQETTNQSEEQPQREQPTTRNSRERNLARASHLADLMDELNRIQGRLQPYMTRYNELLRNETTYATETEQQEAQTLFDRVSGTMHALAHAYHALSDVICPFERPAPRVLLCRPTIVQQAVFQAGIDVPIHVQAQMEVENIRNPFAPRNNQQNNTGNQENGTSERSNANPNSESTNERNQRTTTTRNTAGSAPESTAQPTAPVTDPPIPTIRPQFHVTHRPNSGRNVDIIVAMSPDDVPNQPEDGSNNQDLIQSLIHAVTNYVLHGVNLGGSDVPVMSTTASMGPPPMDSPLLMRVHRPSQSASATTATPATTTTTTTSGNATESDASQASSTATASPTAAGLNSQARGNTATLPTTSTQTPRATHRPHVHLSPHPLRTFDPLLQCNSHHITGRNPNRNGSRNGEQTRSSGTNSRERSPIVIRAEREINLPHFINPLTSRWVTRGPFAAVPTPSAAPAAASATTVGAEPTTSQRNATSSTSTTRSSLTAPVNMDVDTFYDASGHEDDSTSDLRRPNGQKVLLPTSNGESSTPVLPNVEIGSETWHNNVPSEWVSVVTRDISTQRENTQQQSYSDAYLSSVPAKRRKVIQCQKPNGSSLPQVIQESLRQAVLTSGLAQVAPLDLVVDAAGGDVHIQAAYREELRHAVRARPASAQIPGNIAPVKRFPNASVCFQKP